MGPVRGWAAESVLARVVWRPARLRSRVSHTYRKSYFPVPVGLHSWCRLQQWLVQGLALEGAVWARLPVAAERGPPDPPPRRSYRKRSRPASLVHRRQNSWWRWRWERVVPGAQRARALVPVPGFLTLLHNRRKKQLRQVVVNHNSDMQA